MKNVTISIIAAIGPNRELGKDNKLLWHIPEDMKRFKEFTTGHAVIMGQRTFESIGKLLPNRVNIILTHNIYEFKTKHQYFFRHSGKRTERAHPESDSGVVTTFLPRMTGAVLVSSIDEALKEAKRFEKDEVFVIGGGMIYKQFFPLADKLYLTLVEGEYEADTFFPEYSTFKKVVSTEVVNTGKYKLTFFVLEK